MNLNKLITNYVKNREKKERKIGRYWASDLYGIISGKRKPKDFLEKEILSPKDCRNIAEGELRELGLKLILDGTRTKYEFQVKKELKIDDFVIVTVSDFLFPDKVLECKAPNKIRGIMEWHRPQLEVQCRAFKRPVYIGFFKERWEHKFYQYKESDELWLLIQKKLKEFHEELKSLNLKTSK